ncbi:hypothetical protein BT96DRAFT_736085, partial [Gymnopus androsaceus JB14]
KRINGQVNEAEESETIAQDTEIEELQAELKDLEENGEQTRDNIEGFVDILNEMMEEERQEWNTGVKPIRGALIKTHQISFKIINLPTLLLPCWRTITALTPFENQTLPQDVSTHWNSTYDMLKAFSELKELVIKFTDSLS